MLAIGLTVAQLLHFALPEGSLAAFPAQVRFWYLMLLLVALPEPMRLIYWVPTVGTWAQLIFGYCTPWRAASRCLPWNRKERLFSRPAGQDFPFPSRARQHPAGAFVANDLFAVIIKGSGRVE